MNLKLGLETEKNDLKNEISNLNEVIIVKHKQDHENTKGLLLEQEKLVQGIINCVAMS